MSHKTIRSNLQELIAHKFELLQEGKPKRPKSRDREFI